MVYSNIALHTVRLTTGQRHDLGPVTRARLFTYKVRYAKFAPGFSEQKFYQTINKYFSCPAP